MRIEFTPDPDLYPFESRWFDGSAGRMHYVDEGSGTPILFCHGNPTWGSTEKRVAIDIPDDLPRVQPRSSAAGACGPKRLWTTR